MDYKLKYGTTSNKDITFVPAKAPVTTKVEYKRYEPKETTTYEE